VCEFMGVRDGVVRRRGAGRGRRQEHLSSMGAAARDGQPGGGTPASSEWQNPPPLLSVPLGSPLYAVAPGRLRHRSANTAATAPAPRVATAATISSTGAAPPPPPSQS
jgi:hypothetical protein